MDDAARSEQVCERKGERSSATTEISPRRWPKLADPTAREHLDRITQPHGRIIVSAASLPFERNGCGVSSERLRPELAPGGELRANHSGHVN